MNDDVLAHFAPGFVRKDFVQIIQNSTGPNRQYRQLRVDLPIVNAGMTPVLVCEITVHRQDVDAASGVQRHSGAAARRRHREYCNFRRPTGSTPLAVFDGKRDQ
jgi:hypothetical protein